MSGVPHVRRVSSIKFWLNCGSEFPIDKSYGLAFAPTRVVPLADLLSSDMRLPNKVSHEMMPGKR